MSAKRPKIPSPDGLDVLTFTDAQDFERWLDGEFAREKGIWIAIAKKDSGATSVTYAQALEAALCFGWIDGQRRAHDERFFLQRFTPRRPRSPWSKVNRTKIEALIAEGRVRPSGMAEVERAQLDGRWDAAYEGAKTATVPAALQAELDANPDAAAFFKTLSSQDRFAFIYRVNEAKREETRERRVAKFIEMLKNGETL